MTHYERALLLYRECEGNTVTLQQKCQREIEVLENDTHCKSCGCKEVITWFPKYKSNLTDGLCGKCEIF